MRDWLLSVQLHNYVPLSRISDTGLAPVLSQTLRLMGHQAQLEGEEGSLR